MYLKYSQNIAHKPGGGYIVQTKIPAGIKNPYYEILTDYSDYTIVYTCVNVNGKYDHSNIYIKVWLIFNSIGYIFILATIWINGRLPEFNEHIFQMALKRLAEVGVPPQKWSKSHSKNC